MIILMLFIDTTGGSPPSDIPSDNGWDDGWTEPGSDSAVDVYTWDRDPSVVFNTLNQTIEVDPRPYGTSTAEAQRAADDYGAQVTALQGAGFKAGFRYWKEDNIEAGGVFDGNWWERLPPYVQPTITTATQDWWDDFNARITANAVTPDFKIHDFEVGMSYYAMNEAQRRTYFEPITIDDGANPYPGGSSPYIGAEIWKYSDPQTDAFIQEWEQWNVEMRTTFLSSLTSACPVADSNYSNYKDYLQSFEVRDLRNRPARTPAAQSRFGDISSTNVYLDFDTDWTLTDPEANYTTDRQMVNRRRWKTFLYRINRVETSAAVAGRVVPWIAPPGYGYSGSDTWCPSTVLPFEKMLWRLKMRHMFAMGIDSYILWNPVSNNPNSADTDTFMDDYFTGRTVRGTRPDGLGITHYTSDRIQTEMRITDYSDVFEIDMIHYTVAPSPIEPFSQGFCTEAEPLVINAGATGVAELTAMAEALALVYGPEAPTPSDSPTDVGDFEPIPE
tara:strand:+ start:817 stop:2319 length:1503 start_codon:yes stop_codon:yes gene_type:complete